MKTNTYYTLKELITKYSTWSNQIDLGFLLAHPTISTQSYLHYIVDLVFQSTTTKSASIPFTQDMPNKLFCTYILPRFKESFVGYTEDDNDIQVYEDFIRKFIFILNTTYDKYKGIIEGFESVKAALLAKVKGSTETIYQDTPQSAQGVYSDDQTTTRTLNNVENDNGTPAQRLADCEQNIKDYYLKWSNEFRRVFIYE